MESPATQDKPTGHFIQITIVHARDEVEQLAQVAVRHADGSDNLYPTTVRLRRIAAQHGQRTVSVPGTTVTAVTTTTTGAGHPSTVSVSSRNVAGSVSTEKIVPAAQRIHPTNQGRRCRRQWS